MTTKAKIVTKKVNTASVAKKVNSSLVDASLSAIDTTIENSEKWQKLASKLIKKSEKVRQQQINMFFDTAEAVKGQFITGTKRAKELVGYDAKIAEKFKDLAFENPVSKKVVGILEDISEKVSENPMVQKVEKTAEDFKSKGIARFKEIKGDVLEQASKIVDKAEKTIEDAKSENKKEAIKSTKTPIAKVAKSPVKKVIKSPVKKVATTTKVDSKLTKNIAPKTDASDLKKQAELAAKDHADSLTKA